MIGRILGGRYEVLERIGGGGMAIVYRALDTFLNRPVAVKVLRAQFVSDEDLVARFRREARAAASLSDPRIVGVYDVGREGDIDYIVMEFVDGRTLKERIQQEGPLSPRAAADVARHLLVALESAHEAGIVHRDVKPQNVIITRDGRVKVTDFGIAQASGSVTVGNTGSIIGTAHYLAPEQARGRPADERSDVYATGVVLYEMLAGHPPFLADTALAVAMKHLQEAPPDLRAERPDVPPDLARIVARAMEKDPVRRYPTAAAFRVDLEAFAAGRALEWAASPDEGDPGDTLVLRPGRKHPVAAGPEAGGGNARPGGRPRSRRRARVWIAVAALLLLIAGGATYGAAKWISVPDVQVPNVMNLPLDQAQAKLKEAGLASAVGAPVYSADVPATDVAGQDPQPGTVVKTTHVVTLFLSKGPEYVQGGVPDVVGKTARDAEVALTNARLKYTERTQYDDTTPQGTVIGTSPPAGDSIRVGDTVQVVVSDGPKPAPFDMPDLEGRTLAQAQALLDQLGLTVASTQTAQTSWPENVVAGQTPAPGTPVQGGDQVTLVVSSGCAHASDLQVTPSSEQFSGTVQVEADVVDSAGTHKELLKAVQPGDVVTVHACWVGDSATLNVYFNGSLAQAVQLR